MRKFENLIDRIIYFRSEEVAFLIGSDPHVQKAEAEFETAWNKIKDPKLHGEMEDAVSFLRGRELDATYKIGFIDGMKFLLEMKEMDQGFDKLLGSFKQSTLGGYEAAVSN